MGPKNSTRRLCSSQRRHTQTLRCSELGGSTWAAVLLHASARMGVAWALVLTILPCCRRSTRSSCAARSAGPGAPLELLCQLLLPHFVLLAGRGHSGRAVLLQLGDDLKGHQWRGGSLRFHVCPRQQRVAWLPAVRRRVVQRSPSPRPPSAASCAAPGLACSRWRASMAAMSRSKPTRRQTRSRCMSLQGGAATGPGDSFAAPATILTATNSGTAGTVAAVQPAVPAWRRGPSCRRAP